MRNSLPKAGVVPRGSGVDRDAGTVHDDVTRLPDPRSLLRRHGLRCTYSRLRILTLCADRGSTSPPRRSMHAWSARATATTPRRCTAPWTLTALGVVHAVPRAETHAVRHHRRAAPPHRVSAVRPCHRPGQRPSGGHGEPDRGADRAVPEGPAGTKPPFMAWTAWSIPAVVAARRGTTSRAANSRIVATCSPCPVGTAAGFRSASSIAGTRARSCSSAVSAAVRVAVDSSRPRASRRPGGAVAPPGSGGCAGWRGRG
ncbi:hypothetical protein SUDANB66_00550 [Streptomyces sp. SudanB66_2053]